MEPAARSETADPNLLICPLCTGLTDSLKCYVLMDVYFVLVDFAMFHEEVTACPSCMRKHLARKTKWALLTANVFWPLVAFVNGGFYLMTYLKGHRIHFASVQNYRPDRPPGPPASFQPRPSFGRVLVVLAILALLLSVVLWLAGE